MKAWRCEALKVNISLEMQKLLFYGKFHRKLHFIGFTQFYVRTLSIFATANILLKYRNKI